MSKKSIKEYLKQVYRRYRKASKRVKQMILNEFCANTAYNRKYVIRILNGTAPSDKVEVLKRKRSSVYGAKVISVLAGIWTGAGYPCSEVKGVIASLAAMGQGAFSHWLFSGTTDSSYKRSTNR